MLSRTRCLRFFVAAAALCAAAAWGAPNERPPDLAAVLDGIDAGGRSDALLSGYVTRVLFAAPTVKGGQVVPDPARLVHGRTVSVHKLSYRWLQGKYLTRQDEFELLASGDRELVRTLVSWNAGEGYGSTIEESVIGRGLWEDERMDATAVAQINESPRESEGWLRGYLQLDTSGQGLATTYARAEVVGIEDVDGLECVHLVSDTTDPESGLWGAEHVWVAPAHGYRRARREAFVALPDGRVNTSVEMVTAFEEVVPGLWMPAEIHSVGYLRKPTGEWTWTRAAHVICHSAKAPNPGALLLTPLMPNNTLLLWPDGVQDHWGHNTVDLEASILAGQTPFDFALPELRSGLPEAIR